MYTVRLITLFVLTSLVCSESASGYGVYRLNFEMKPLQALASDDLGFSGFAAEVEAMLWGRFALVVGGSRLQLVAPEKSTGTSTGQRGDISAESATSNKLRAGLRSYTRRGASSFYLGAYHQRTEDAYQSTSFQQELHLDGRREEALFELGYRWYWSRGMVFRLGVHLLQSAHVDYHVSEDSAGIGLTREIAAELAHKFSQQRESKRSELVFSTDIGIGITF